MMNEEREQRLRSVALQRQFNLTVILENVHDPHNLGAVVRTCDSVGIHEIYVIYSEPGLIPSEMVIGKRTSQGTRKWVDVYVYDDTEKGMQAVKEKYDHIYATHLHHDAKSIHETDLTTSCAILLGNEKDGLTEGILKYADKNIVIPQWGMAQSLNISVACAVTLYESLRQRGEKNMYLDNSTRSVTQGETIVKEYFRRHVEQHVGDKIIKK